MPELENKSNDAAVGAAFNDFMRAFEAFKETNDDRLDQLERRSAVDPLIEEKLNRIDRALDDNRRVVDDMALKAARPAIGGEAPRSAASLAHRSAFDNYVRKGESGALADLERKALSVGSNADGGYLVPVETEHAVNRALRDISPIRAIASVQQVSGAVYKRPFSISGPVTGWAAETGERTQTTAPKLDALSFPTAELYAMPAATSTLLDDVAVNIDEWLAEEVRIAFAEQEGKAFVTGNGTNKPKGFLDYTTALNSAWEWGKIGVVETGVSAAFPSSDPVDKLIDLVYALKAGYRANAHFVLNRSTQSLIRKMKDADDNYLWQPSVNAGEAPTLMGFPVAESEDMPSIAANSLSIAFGDFRRGYLIVDRIGIRVLRDPYSVKPYVLFYTTKRVGGGVQDFDAIKLMKFSAPG
ncbi:Phage major capsid protein [Hyphomicrobium sulfonivorans]|uniref:Phage major capsid protein n=1 Tax=Hyphomicrobium sulfonivorans TaxID=121290 RepID=A0A120CV12_HYPSL|nr:phage major capsid protein [Hyphomicrobium sulfonivorans]KWT67002.1 Phage major capsid protein [Hyphomicrobium sulfonivorans]